MPLLTLSALKFVDSDLTIKAVAPLVATSEHCKFDALHVGVFTYAIADNSRALDIDVPFISIF